MNNRFEAADDNEQSGMQTLVGVCGIQRLVVIITSGCSRVAGGSYISSLPHA